MYMYIRRSLFYIDTGDYDRFEYPKIYYSAMDGTARIVVVSNDLVRPLYIAVDNNGVNGQIFWTDSYYNSIMSATFEGRNARTVVSKSNGFYFVAQAESQCKSVSSCIFSYTCLNS